MDGYLKQSTATSVKVGPFLDDSDGKTAETGLTISQADVRLSKNGANIAQKNDEDACSHDELGYYDCPLSTTDTNTVGQLKLMVHEAGALPVWHTYTVLSADVYDSLFGSTALATVGAAMALAANQDVRNVSGSITDKTGYSVTGDFSATMKTSVETAVAAQLNAAIPDSPTANSINERVKAIDDKLPSKAYLTGTANADGDIQANEATGNFPGTVGKSAATLAAGDVSGNLPANVVDWKGSAAPAMSGDAYARLGAPAGASVSADVAAIKSDSAAILADTGTDGVVVAAGSKSGYALTAAYDAAKTAAQAGDAMTLANDAITAAKFDETTAFPLKSADAGATAVARTGADGDTLETLSDQVDALNDLSAEDVENAVLDAALEDHDGVGTAGAGIAAAGSAGDPWSTALPGAYGAGTAGKLVGDNLNATVGSRLASTGYTAPPSAADIKSALEATGSHLALILEDTGVTADVTEKLLTLREAGLEKTDNGDGTHTIAFKVDSVTVATAIYTEATGAFGPIVWEE